MKSKTQRNLAVLIAGVMAIGLGLKSLGDLDAGSIGYFLFDLGFAIGMVATVIALFKLPSEGTLYNIVIMLGGLPSLGLVALSLWMIFTGSFSAGAIVALVAGLFGLFAINPIVNTETNQPSPAEANE